MAQTNEEFRKEMMEMMQALKQEQEEQHKEHDEQFKQERSRATKLEQELKDAQDRLKEAERKGAGVYNHEEAAMAKTIYAQKPYLTVVRLKDYDVQKMIEEWTKVPAARTHSEKQSVSDICRMSVEGKIEPMVATLAYYLTDDASPAERTLMLQWITSGTPGRVQLEHQALMLSKRTDSNALLDDTSGHILAAPFPLFYSPYNLESVRVLNQKVKDLRQQEVVGGGPYGPLTDQSSCGGFHGSPWAREVSGGGSLPVIEMADGKLATDTTFLEAHLAEMRKGFGDAFQTMRKSVEELQEQKTDTATPDDVRQMVKKAVDRCTKKLENVFDDRVSELEERVEQRRRNVPYKRQLDRNQYSGHQRRSGFR